jgi:hypothetical protein
LLRGKHDAFHPARAHLLKTRFLTEHVFIFSFLLLYILGLVNSS